MTALSQQPVSQKYNVAQEKTVVTKLSTTNPNLVFVIIIPVIKKNFFIKYSQTCIKRSPLGHRKSGLIRQVTF